ncbi:MAG TPA: hypothetical protein VGP80_05790 [Gemmatimonadales bacterium]|jgi:hypothetical protein|nr:hypothetical protein [Gemmatimonadales bacterium]
MKSFVIYLILVGIPIAGVVGVLQAGRGITPPPYVGGTWAVTFVPDSTCHSSPGAPEDSVTSVIMQSGSHVVVTFANSALPKLRGLANGQYFRVASSSDSVHMHGAIKRGENRMRGFLVGVPCAAARRTTFRGTRVAPPGAVGAH